MIKLALLALLQVAADSPTLDLSVETISGAGFAVSGLETTLQIGASGIRGAVQIRELRLLDSGDTFDDIRVRCALVRLTTRSIACNDAEFSATIPGIGRQTVPGTFAYDRQTGETRVSLARVALAGRTIRVDIAAGETGIDIEFHGRQLQLSGLLDLAREFDLVAADYSVQGLADVSGRYRTTAGGGFHIAIGADVEAMSLANDAGTVAADSVSANIELDLRISENVATMDMVFESAAGEAYLEPVYANFSEHAIRLRADEITTADFATFTIADFRLQQETLLDMNGAATLVLPGDDASPIGLSAAVELTDASASNLYASLLQVQVAGTVLGELDTDGRLSGTVSITDNALTSASLELNDIVLDDRRGRFAIYGLSGEVNWHADPGVKTDAGHLRWDSGTAYNITIGGGNASFQLGDDDIELLEPLRLPTMGGALLINRFALHDYGTVGASGVLDAELEPIQLGQLTGAFGWPAFSGTLSGRLPLLQLREDTVTVGGTLSARAFDGTIQVSKLRIEQPFGLVPRLQGEIQLRDLDLQHVTDAFSFGLIQGRLSGDVTGLTMQNWRPVAMDMHFYTPANDRSQHRISQRAVENLASVGGGGAAAVLSTGFMQFFEVFAYDRIGLRCELRNTVCAMSGAGPAKTGPQGAGYYIVKGKGVPRIDVVGYRDRVSWPSLVQQLAAITRSDTLTIN